MTSRDEPHGSEKDQPQHAREDAELRARLAKLSDALDAQASQEAESRVSQAQDSTGSALNFGFRVMSEFVAAVIVGTFIGWQIDSFAGTSPGFLLLFIVLGTAAGLWNVYRMAAKPQR
jgi:ATP synthase protein I